MSAIRNLSTIAIYLLAVHLAISWQGVGVADAAITFNGAKCGTKYCKVDQYCSKYDKQCESCSTICDDATHNFDMEMCTRECQDYLHDMRYARSNHGSEEFYRLRKQLNIVLILLAVVLAMLAISNGVRLVKWCRGRGIVSTLLRKIKLKRPRRDEKVAPENLTHVNPNTQSPKVQLRNVPLRGAPNLQINRDSTVFSIDGASSIQTVSTPISTRYPAEDSTLNYSYDNAALAITPTIPERPKTNSSGPF